MKKAILISFLIGMTVSFHSSFAQDHTISQSAYLLKPNDPKAVYFTKENFNGTQGKWRCQIQRL